MLMKRSVNILGALCGLSLILTACQKSEEPPVSGSSGTSPATESGKKADAPVADAGVIKGKVFFEGTPPEPQEIKLDTGCMAAHGNQKMFDESLIVNGDKTLKNCFVYIKSGLSETYATPQEALLLDQKGCRYEPRVFGVMVGQTIEVKNSDPLLHNVRGATKINNAFNLMQPQQGQVDKRAFDKPEIMVEFKCDVHPWMKSWCGVLPHPYFVVTGEEGAFEIGNVPPGKYTIEVWHETLGRQSQEVEVAPNGSAELKFVYNQK